MEFPDLGRYCCERTCKGLDRLPLKCDACNEVFCKDHSTYSLRQCASAYKKDVQVPICPLCNTPVPVRKGEMPDAVVGAHMDGDCKRDPDQPKRKIFTNKCFKPGCKRREMMQLICNQCCGNFCLKHRHPLDHSCQGQEGGISKAGCAALMRSMESRQNSLRDHFLQSRYKLKS